MVLFLILYCFLTELIKVHLINLFLKLISKVFKPCLEPYILKKSCNILTCLIISTTNCTLFVLLPDVNIFQLIALH